MSTLDHTLKPEASAVRRLEVITGIGRRRQFSEDFKAGIVEETLVPGAIVSEVARRHGLTPQQLFGWRRQAREAVSAETGDRAPLFVPAVVEPAPTLMVSPATSAAKPDRKRRARKSESDDGLIEVEIGGITIRVGRGADADTVAAVIAALKVAT